MEEKSEVATEETEEHTEELSTEEEEKVRSQKYMVTYDKERKDWVVKKTGAQKASKRCKTKKEAMEVVTRLADNQELNISVKKKNGKFQKTENATRLIKNNNNNNNDTDNQ